MYMLYIFAMSSITLSNKQTALMCGCLLGWPLVSIIVCSVLGKVLMHNFFACWLVMGLFAMLCLGNAIYGTTKAYAHLKRGQFAAIAITATAAAGWGIFLILRALDLTNILNVC